MDIYHIVVISGGKWYKLLKRLIPRRDTNFLNKNMSWKNDPKLIKLNILKFGPIVLNRN